MKNRKKFVIIFSLFWVIGLLGGYFIASSFDVIPESTVDYNYYYSGAKNSNVESISKDFFKTDRKATEKTECEKSSKSKKERTLELRLNTSEIKKIPQKIIEHLISPQACADPCKTKEETKKA